MEQTFIVAELSANHGHKLETALESIRAISKVGVDAVKIQTYTPDTLTLDCRKKDFIVSGGTIWDNTTYYDLYKEAYTPWEWHEAIFEEARKCGLVCFSTPFDNTAVDFLERCKNPIYKIASFEITDVNLIRYAASKGKPMIISTGVATIEDIELAIKACHEVDNYNITLLHCVSAYPAPLQSVNLLTMQDMKERFGVKVGLSDHTIGQDVAVAAIGLGAKIVEKHFILDRAIGGPDATFSMTVEEFKSMVISIRNIEKALGVVEYPIDPTQIKGRQFSRSLYIAENIKAGEVLTEKNLRSVRPGFGLAPKYLNECLGKRVNRDLDKGERMSLEFLDK